MEERVDGDIHVTLQPGEEVKTFKCTGDAHLCLDASTLLPNAPVTFHYKTMTVGGNYNLSCQGPRVVTVQFLNTTFGANGGMITSKHDQAFLEIDRKTLATTKRITGFVSVQILENTPPAQVDE